MVSAAREEAPQIFSAQGADGPKEKFPVAWLLEERDPRGQRREWFEEPGGDYVNAAQPRRRMDVFDQSPAAKTLQSQIDDGDGGQARLLKSSGGAESVGHRVDVVPLGQQAPGQGQARVTVAVGNQDAGRVVRGLVSLRHTGRHCKGDASAKTP
ncbi:MAG: hypothetical protein ABJA82_10495 [Myxococcales bacterium]